ncbi:MAG: tetratricopeptide repeat protein [Fimbriimonas sp.]|nr:tetratricopeptide repeat protein [Fimbriimonas sp.]
MKLRSRILLSLAGLTTVVVPAALAHIWFEEKTIHFRGGTVDFGEPPSRYALYDSSHDVSGQSPWRPGMVFLERYRDGDDSGEVDPTHLYHKATQLESEGKYRQALKTWRWGWTHGVGNQAIVRERIDLLRILAGSPKLSGAAEYLRATAAFKPSGIVPQPASLASAIRPFAAFRLADDGRAKPINVARRLMQVANDYPQSPMAEPALISVPRTLLAAPVNKIVPEEVALSRLAIDDLAKRYPHSRFRFDVVGWRGRIAYLAGRYAEAIAIYRRQFALAPTWRKRATVYASLVLCEREAGNFPAVATTALEVYGAETDLTLKGSAFALIQQTLGRFNGAQANRFWRRLHDSPKLLGLYLDYRMEMTEPTPDLLKLSANGGASAFASSYGGHILARLAQAAYVLKKNSAAVRYANRALAATHDKADDALATFVLASIDRREGRYADATKRYEAILAHYPGDLMSGGARENLAILYERAHRFADALDLYRKLGYVFDMAYLLDIRMTPEQVATYVAAHPKDKEIDLLRFSLGVRYLRADRFDDAERELSRLSDAQRTKFCPVLYQSEIGSKDIDPELIQDPLQTARQLGRLYRQFSRARTSESKAKVLTFIADYYYDRHDLLLYNPALWHHVRAVGIGTFWDATVATKEDYQALEKHHWDHDCYARALTLCEKILKKYPHASVRYRVAYRAGCAAEHLSHMNPYWRWQGRERDLMGRAVNLMSMAKRSPDPQLSAKARKYVRVFVERRESDRQAFAEEEKDRKTNHYDYSNQAKWSYY